MATSAYGVVGETRSDGAAAEQPGTRPGGLAVLAELRGHPFSPGKGGVQFTGDTYPLAEVRLLAPVLPSKVVAVARNYAGDGRETGDEPGLPRVRVSRCCSSSRPPRWSGTGIRSPTRSSSPSGWTTRASSR